MLSRLLILVALCAATLLPASEAQAERRIALVIGNSAYAHAKTLRNPQHDASDVAESLKQLGFDVLLGLDLDQQKFARTIDQFARMLDDADVSLFFYAGHGLQMNEKNYLVSTNAKLESEFLLSSETIELDAIIRLMEAKAATNLVFLDACRNNPLTDNLRQNLAAMKRSALLGRGLARVEPTGRDTLIAFAAAPGQEAADGADRNSPFTKSLLKNIPTPGLEVSVMLKEVAADVRRETRNVQRPQQLSDMSRTFYFAKAVPVVAQAAPPAPAAPAAQPATQTVLPGVEDRTLEVAFWNAASSANDCDAVRAYLSRFPNGAFVELAKLSERRLCSPGRRIEVITPGGGPSAEPTASAMAPLAPPPSAPARPAPKLAALPDAAAPAEPESAGVELARTIQLELVRLGCASGRVDGKWGPSTRDAMRRFNKSARTNLDTDEPATDTIAALRQRQDRVCVPVTIEREPARKPRKAERTPERRPLRARPAEVEIAPPRRPRPAPPAAAASRPFERCMVDEGQGRMRPCDSAGGR